jgi:hypothetical protein
MSNISYVELKNRCRRHWLTRGPDLDGEAGYALLDDRMYYWTWLYGEDSALVEHHLSMAEFLAQHQATTDTVLARVVADLLSLPGRGIDVIGSGGN